MQIQGQRGRLSDSLVSRREANDVHILIPSNVKVNVCKPGLKPTLRRMGPVPRSGFVKVQGVMLSNQHAGKGQTKLWWGQRELIGSKSFQQLGRLK